MNKEWQKNKEEQYYAELARRKQAIIDRIKQQTIIPEDKRIELVKCFESLLNPDSSMFEFILDIQYGYYDFCESKKVSDYKKYQEWVESLELQHMRNMIEYKSSFDGSRCLDSEPLEFDGDIIITDPCYITKKLDTSDRPKFSDYHKFSNVYEYPDYDEKTKSSMIYLEESDRYNTADKIWSETHIDDWQKCECGENMEALGLKTVMTRDTIYGDWSCTTYDVDTDEPIGRFCADSGLVSVMLLDEVLKYNPDFDYHEERNWTTTLIKDFKGTVQFVVVYTEGLYEDETEYHKKGDKWTDYSLEVVGHGINKVTGKPINFVGKQSGF